MIGRGHPREGIPGDCIAIPVEERLAQLTARVPGVRRLVHVDIGDRSDDARGVHTSSCRLTLMSTVVELNCRVGTSCYTVAARIHIEEGDTQRDGDPWREGDPDGV